ncbi:MAG: MBL fold metallo-hydrolase [Sphaerochaetaceae bacterium]|nr:MBL fold metallo-hydrolase [Sphaerochaetaceae bacterium]
MKLTFIGGAQCVTGSCILLEHEGLRILVDCGMAQGQDVKKGRQELPLDPASIDYVLLTHAHMDHCGRLPLLVAKGSLSLFKGKVICTKATADLCEIMLKDSARIQESDAQWRNKHEIRQGKAPTPPLYTIEDANEILSHFSPVEYEQNVKLENGITIRFTDAGHMLGSSSIILTYPSKDGTPRTIVFSGDIGNINQPIIKDPTYMDKADYVVMESTYGMKVHTQAPKSTEELTDTLQKIIESTFAKGGKVIIPAFSVGRSQEILYLLRAISDRTGKPIPTYLDSPLSIRATAIFLRDAKDYYDEEAMEILKEGKNPILFPGFTAITTSEESKALNTSDESCVIIASSGMCEAGRIQHHLKHNLYKRESTIVFTGYQAQGTLGSKILGGAKALQIRGEKIAVNATIKKLDGISGHADQRGLLNWIDGFTQKPKKVFVVHGDESSSIGFSTLLQETRNLDSTAPRIGQTFELD